MNKERREELLEVTGLLDEAIDRIGEIRDEEEDALYSLQKDFKNLPKVLLCKTLWTLLMDLWIP